MGCRERSSGPWDATKLVRNSRPPLFSGIGKDYRWFVDPKALSGHHFQSSLWVRSPKCGEFAVAKNETTEDAKPLLVYSHRSATMGSTFAARRAGSQLASRATPSNSADTVENISGSFGRTSNNRLPM